MRNFLFILLIVGFAAISITGCDKAMRKSMMESMTMTEMPTADDPEAFTVALVQAAVDLHKTEGNDAIIAHYNDPASIDGQWYVFITDENGLFVAHAPSPDLIGTDLKDLIDLDGFMFGVEIAKATEVGRWIEYLWSNPETGEIELKRTWAIRHDGYLFGSGYYEPVAEDESVAGDAVPAAKDATSEAN